MNTTSNETYVVLINHEEQYSLWPSAKAVPAGWTVVKTEAAKDECLDFVEENWTDMRPLSLRKAMEQTQVADAD